MGSVWDVARVQGQDYPPLYQDLTVDVAVIGAGITGLATALRLAEEGLSVAVLEAMRVGQGSTGGSTGNLYGTVDLGLAAIRRKWGDAITQQVATARMEAIAFIEDTVRRFGIDCQFARRPWYLILSGDDPKLEQRIEDDYQASRDAGLKASLVHEVPLPVGCRRALKLDDQAQFNPLRFCQGLAQALTAQGGHIFEQSAVTKVDPDAGVVETERAKVHAKHIMHATHTPKGVNVLQTEMEPYREYGITARLAEQPYPEGAFWVLDRFHSLRSYHYAGADYLIVVGERHKVGHGTLGEAYYEHLREYARSHFKVADFEHQWSAQQYRPADDLPYIGLAPGADKAYVGTGYAADGLTWGVVAGMIISDLIVGRDNRWRECFDPGRFTPVKSAKKFLKQNAMVAEHYLKDYLTPSELKSVEGVAAGEGKVVSLAGEKLAVYRDRDGKLSVLSATCTHLKCLVHWNAADTSWDCPCHGSRFGTDGSVLEGPALHPLAQRAPKA